MLKRTIYIGNPAYLKTKHQQLVIEDSNSHELKGKVPVEDIGLLLLDHYQITISNQLLILLQSRNVVVISCDQQHMPFALMQPMYGHTEFSERIKQQLQVSEPLKKQLWKQTIESKIHNQQLVLQYFEKEHEGIISYKNEVKSGDGTNREGIAAQYYWKHLFSDFNRERYGDAPNHMLNYGYAILRSIIARALVGSGLLPVMGIFHRNKYNPYCLADDIMEPYRPFVDKMVYNYIETNGIEKELSKEAKIHLMKIATHDVSIDGKKRPLLVATSITTSSLQKCYSGELKLIRYPTLV